MELVESLCFSSFTVPLNEPFGIATGAHLAAENVLIQLRLQSGTWGVGEAAPAPHISGETRAQVLACEGEVREALRGEDLRAFRRVSARRIRLPTPCGPPVQPVLTSQTLEPWRRSFSPSSPA